MVRFGEKGGAWLRLFIFGKIHSFILLNWFLLPACSADRFLIGFRESSISLLSKETDAGGS
jgi:hypothetical protein